jgi:hypothetical protein
MKKATPEEQPCCGVVAKLDCYNIPRRIEPEGAKEEQIKIPRARARHSDQDMAEKRVAFSPAMRPELIAKPKALALRALQ